MRRSVWRGSGPSREMATIVPHRPPATITGLATADRKEAGAPSQRVATSEETPLSSSIRAVRPVRNTSAVARPGSARPSGRGRSSVPVPPTRVAVPSASRRMIRVTSAPTRSRISAATASNTSSGAPPWAISVATRRSAACSSASSLRAVSEPLRAASGHLENPANQDADRDVHRGHGIVHPVPRVERSIRRDVEGVDRDGGGERQWHAEQRAQSPRCDTHAAGTQHAPQSDEDGVPSQGHRHRHPGEHSRARDECRGGSGDRIRLPAADTRAHGQRLNHSIRSCPERLRSASIASALSSALARKPTAGLAAINSANSSWA